ncbi:MAG: ComEC family competence protein [Saprospirales bacterium]|nr:MAG: ComEC family competence protein [Saprospirales bacterium]
MPISFSEVPFLRILLFWITGTTLYVFGFSIADVLKINGVLILFLLLPLVLKHFSWRTIIGLALMIALMNTAYYRSYQLDNRHLDMHFSTQLDCEDKIHFTAKIKEIRQGSNSTTSVVEILSALCEDRPETLKTTTGNLLLSISEEENIVELIPGRIIGFTANVFEIGESSNPRSFSYKNYMARQRVFHRARVSLEEIHFAENSKRNFRERLHRFRLDFIGNLKKHTDKDLSPGMITGIVLGDRSLLKDEINSAFRDVGAAHVLAVSGLHVGIVFSILFFFLHKVNKYLRTALIMIGVWSFIVFAGMPPSAVRAGSMFSLFALGQLVGRRGHSLNILAFCAVLHLFIEPNLMRDVGFQFSYLALGGIIVFFNKINGLIPSFHPWVNPLKDLSCLSIAAQLGVLPLSIYYFNQASPYFMLSSLFSVFGAYIILSGGLLLGFSGFIFSPLANILGWIMDWSCAILARIMIGFTELPYATAREIYLSWPALLMLYVMILLLAFIFYRRIKTWQRPVILSLIVFMLMGFQSKVESTTGTSIYVYSTGRELLVDVFSPNLMTTIKSNRLSSSAENFASKGNRIYYRTRDRDLRVVETADSSNLIHIQGSEADILIMINEVSLPINFNTERPVHLILSGLRGITTKEMKFLGDLKPLSITSAAGNTRSAATFLKETAEEIEIEFHNTFNRYHSIKNF